MAHRGLTSRVHNQSTVVVKRWSIYKQYYPSQFGHSPLTAASRVKNRAMGRTTGVLVVKNRLRDYRLFRANYGPVL